MAANIQLYRNDKPSPPTDNVSKFNLLFQDRHGIQDFPSLCYWRDVEISTAEEPLVSDDTSEDTVIHNLELLNKRKLCELIIEARDSQSQVRLIRSEGALRLQRDTIPSIRFLTNAPSTSLADLLQCSELPDKNKMILSYLLVESVWQFYNHGCDGWEDWSNETVQFMSQGGSLDDSPEMIYVNQLFLYVKFYKNMPPIPNGSILSESEGSVGTGELQNSQLALKVIRHKYPKILALGIMLLEIQLGGKLESFKNHYVYEKNPNIARYLRASYILEDKNLWPPKAAWLVIKEIIETCIDGTKARALLGCDPEQARQNIYDNIVAPLRVFILGVWEQKGIKDIEPVRLERVSHSERRELQVLESPSGSREHDQKLTQSLKSAEEWLQKLSDLAYALSHVGKRDKKRCPEIKIAILDTGITKEYYDKFKAYIEEYKDFASGEDELQQDGDGHGSTILRLLLKLNYHVKIFVGRVFKSKEADDDTERVMTEAILHAKREWKVDIICLPSGFNLHAPNPSIRDGLYDALTSTEGVKTLIFAAASNLGLGSQVTFPGCLSQHSKLICLFATAGDGDPDSPRFNPAAVPNTCNFALLGEGIKIDPDDQPIGGTSYSTVIAAAIAAYIMDFANHSDTIGKIEHERVPQPRAMEIDGQ
ncbi:hypothetical protein ACQKWADRAFT_311310 [Trichoderma austrokoningii]